MRRRGSRAVSLPPPWISKGKRSPVRAKRGTARIGSVVGKNAEQILSIGPLIFLGVVAHNGLGLWLGFGVGTMFRFGKAERRTLAIAVGMQNSGLAVALAAAHAATAGPNLASIKTSLHYAAHEALLDA